MVRSAFTLIELIFAIVVIGISVISLPMMNQVTTKGIEGNLVQEIIFVAATELNQAVTANWDDNSLEPGEPNSMARVIDIYTGAGRCEINPNLPTYRQMAGHINQPLHRRCLESNATGVATVNVADVDDLNDMSLANAPLENANKTASGYKSTFTTTIVITNEDVIFGTDQANANPNMKRVTVTINDADGPVTELSTYSANIGEIDYYKRSY